MAQAYHGGQRTFQDRFDTRRLGDRLAESATDVISDAHKAFIERRDMFFLATVDEHGWPESSYKGASPASCGSSTSDPWFEGTLPQGDPALDPEHPSAPSIP